MHEPIERVALLGYGRFGRSFADLLEDAGLAVRAFDPVSEVPAARCVADVATLVGDVDAVVIAVPVDALAAGLASILPHLDPRQLVIDVASVKQRAVATFDTALGDAVPWAATHPLFGPSSVAAGERPLRVVVCPNPRHPSAAGRARLLYERLGCSVAVQDAAEHDRLMARTHALAFFVAKGLLDIGLCADLPFAPPSFRAMARTIEAVQSDAGHLFETIERDNPYAARERRSLLDALGRIDDLLAAGGDASTARTSASTAIPELGAAAADRRAIGELIAECDRELVRGLARRTRLVGRMRREEPGSDDAPDREALHRVWREELGLSGDELATALAALRALGD